MKDLFNSIRDGSIRDTKLGTYYRAHVVDKAPIDPSVPTSYIASALPGSRVSWLGTVMVGLCIVLLGRLVWLQVLHGSDYRAQADANRSQIITIPAARGLIYDVTGLPLVKNEPNFVVLEKNTNKNNTQPHIVQEFVAHDKAIALMAQFHDSTSVYVEAQTARHYTQPDLYAHILGYIGRISNADLADGLADDYELSDQIGKTGLESTYEAVLHGKKGTITKETTAAGQAMNDIAEEPAIPGENLVLTIDTNLQQLLYDELKNMVDSKGLPGASAVALDPNTGAIRALVSYPSYDPNLFIKGITANTYADLINDSRKPLFNRVISGEYPSGSTFKLIVASAALQEGVVTPATTVNSVGGIMVDSLFPDWKAGGHGITNIYKALAESVNTYFYIAGGGTYDKDTREITGGLGIDRIAAYAKEFGLGEESGIPLPGEADGFVPTREWKEEAKGEPWYLGDTYHVSIGQGDLLVTPLQVAMYTSVVANGGTLYQPQLVDHITDQAGVTTQTVEPIIRRQQFVDDQYLAVVRAGMRQAVTGGSARTMSSLPMTSAGKTGTAQMGGTDKTHSWYTTFLPYENPKLVLTVLVEEGGESTEAAVPVAKAVLSKYGIDTQY
ncbi:MAG: penicillin-binding protein 2 [Patescibacteria group bacterium]